MDLISLPFDLTLLSAIILTMAGRLSTPEIRVIRTSLLLRISVISAVRFELHLPNYSKIIKPLWFCGISPALVWNEPPAVLLLPPINPGTVALLPANEVKVPS